MSSSFYYRVFTSVERNIWGEEIESFLEETGLGLNVIGVVDEDDERDLDAEPTELLFFDEDESEVASLVYDTLETSEFLSEEIAEFQGIVQKMLPECNRAWVADKLAHSVGCYCFTVFDAGFLNENWDRLATLAEWLRDETNGIEQSDGGQITNEQGAVVLVTPLEDGADDDAEDDNYETEDFDDGDDSDQLYDDETDSSSFDSDEEVEFDDSEDFDEESDEEYEDVDEDYDDEFDDEYEDGDDSLHSDEYDEDDASFEDEPEDDDDEEDVDDSELEVDDESEDFVAAIRVGDRWVEKQVDSDETLAEFMRGES